LTKLNLFLFSNNNPITLVELIGQLLKYLATKTIIRLQQKETQEV